MSRGHGSLSDGGRGGGSVRSRGGSDGSGILDTERVGGQDDLSGQGVRFETSDKSDACSLTVLGVEATAGVVATGGEEVTRGEEVTGVEELADMMIYPDQV
jgi:hypothetical protein